jgi:sugar phosphate permease
VPTLTAVLLAGAPAHLAGTASGVLNTSRQLGGALAVAVFGALIADSARFQSGLQLSLVIAALLLLTTAVASLQLESHQKIHHNRA